MRLRTFLRLCLGAAAAPAACAEQPAERVAALEPAPAPPVAQKQAAHHPRHRASRKLAQNGSPAAAVAPAPAPPPAEGAAPSTELSPAEKEELFRRFDEQRSADVTDDVRSSQP